MSEIPLPRAHEGPRRATRQTFATGRSVPGNGVVTFPARARVEDDRDPADPDTRPSDRIMPGSRLNGAVAVTPPDQFGDTLVISILEQMAETHAKLAEDCRKLAAMLTDPNEAA